MKYSLVVIGKLKHRFYRETCDHFQKRISGYAKVEIIELKEIKAPPTKIKTLEGKALLKVAKGYLIALDEKGRQFNSQELAKEITSFENKGVNHISLLIGGAQGHGENLKDQVSMLWSLSKLTLAHDLAQLVLLEQLYRIETIRAGHPYHRN